MNNICLLTYLLYNVCNELMINIFASSCMLIYFCLFINVFHVCIELMIKHRFFKNKMVSIFHNIIISNL